MEKLTELKAVRLTKTQMKSIEKYKINFSELVRIALDKEIRKKK
jgi:post-segregation antitoxin (ccd killing protein)